MCLRTKGTICLLNLLYSINCASSYTYIRIYRALTAYPCSNKEFKAWNCCSWIYKSGSMLKLGIPQNIFSRHSVQLMLRHEPVQTSIKRFTLHRHPTLSRSETKSLNIAPCPYNLHLQILLN